jgi:hypothetical protein
MPVRVWGRSLARINAFALIKGVRRERRARERKQGCERVLKRPFQAVHGTFTIASEGLGE